MSETKNQIEDSDNEFLLHHSGYIDDKVKLRVSTGYTSCKTLVNICQSPQIDLHKLIFDKTLYRTMNKRDQTGILDIRNCLLRDQTGILDIRNWLLQGGGLGFRDRYNKSLLHYACRYSTLTAVQYLADNSCNVNCVGGKYYRTPLFYCCYTDVPQAVEKMKILVTNGANLDVTDINNISPLHIACALSTVDVVQYLVDNNCNVNCVIGKYNRTPIFYCCYKDVPQAVEKMKVLVSNGAKFDVTDKDSTSPLHLACALSTVDVVQYLVDNNCNVNCVIGKYNRTPIFYCCYKDVPQAVEKMKVLVSNGAKLDVTDIDNTSPLHIACWLSTVDVVQYLIDNGCNVNCVDKYNITPVVYCCLKDVPQAVEKMKVLASNGAKLDGTDIDNTSPLHIACWLSTVGVVQYLADNNCNVNCVDEYNTTPVFYCCFKDVPQAVEKMKVLASNGANLDGTDIDNTSLLHVACALSTVDGVQYLVDNNCNVNCVGGKYNRTPVFYCCLKDVPQAVEKMKVLASNGANLDGTDIDNASLLHVACTQSTVDVVQYLIDNGCKMNCVDKYNRTPVFYCCFKDVPQAVEKMKVLASNGANLDGTDINNESALHEACALSTVDVVQYLVDNKCNVNCVDEYNTTPVFYCCYKDAPQAIEKMKLLVSNGAKLDVTDIDNTSLLHVACALSTVDVVHYLIDNNCNVNCVGGRYNRTPVFYCCYTDVPQAVEKMKVLVSNGANLDVTDIKNTSPLHIACMISTVAVVQYLADNNCNVNCVRGRYNRTPVFYCCFKDVPQAVEKMKVLVSNGAKLDVTDIDNTSPSHIACWLSTVDVVQYLIDNKCNVNCVDGKYNRTPVFYCCYKDVPQAVEKMKVLVSNGVTLYVTDKDNTSPLHVACALSTVDVVQYLIDNNCNVNYVGGRYNRTPLFYCCYTDVPQAVEKMKVLVSNGAYLDFTDIDNTPLLHIACALSTVDVVQCLVYNNCNVNCVGGKYNRTPLFYCCYTDVPQAVEKMQVLVSNGANLDLTGIDNIPLLHIACALSTVDVVQYLVDNNCNVNCVGGKFNRTPVFYCCFKDVPQAVEKINVLVSNGARLDSVDAQNFTLLHLACELSTVEVVEYLIDRNCNVNYIGGRHNSTSVFYSCCVSETQRIDKIKLLLSRGAKLNRGQKLICIEKAKSLGYYDTVQFVDKIPV
ncbi:hypothetical protein SNE40_022124 [Patella caerulea]|uniref:Uncharacterized protein n=1 Tax=Patella caerulea TaxID=87958 RepID=A0AAN8GCI9_PATCE